MIFFKYGKIKNPKVKKYQDDEAWIPVDSATLHVQRPVPTSAPGAAETKRLQGALRVYDIVMTRATDGASTDLFAAVTAKPAANDAEIHFCSATPDGPESYLTWKLGGALITNYDCSSAGRQPHESLSVNFNKIDVQWQKNTAKGWKAGKTDASG